MGRRRERPAGRGGPRRGRRRAGRGLWAHAGPARRGLRPHGRGPGARRGPRDGRRVSWI